MKNINKIMFICMIMTIGSIQAGDQPISGSDSTPAMGKPMMGSSSATYSPTINFTVSKNIPKYVSGMTGNYNPMTAVAMINDARGNIAQKYINVLANVNISYKPEEGFLEIGSYPDGSTARSPKVGARGLKHGAHVAGTFTKLYGQLS